MENFLLKHYHLQDAINGHDIFTVFAVIKIYQLNIKLTVTFKLFNMA